MRDRMSRLPALGAATTLALVASMNLLPAKSPERIGRPSGDYEVRLNGLEPPDARLFRIESGDEDPGQYVVVLPSENRALFVDLSSGKVFTVPRMDVRPGPDGTIALAEQGIQGLGERVTGDASLMQVSVGTSEVQLVKKTEHAGPSPAGAGASAPAAGRSTPAAALGGDKPARNCLQISARAEANAVCSKFVYLKNACARDVVAQVRRVEHLMTGTLPQNFSVVVPGGDEIPLGCSWWKGAMAPTDYDLLDAGYFSPGPAHGRGSRTPSR